MLAGHETRSDGDGNGDGDGDGDSDGRWKRFDGIDEGFEGDGYDLAIH